MSVWLFLHSFRRASWFQWLDTVFMSEHYIKLYRIYPSTDGKERPELNNLSSPQMFIMISFTDRLGHLNYRSTLLWQVLYMHRTKKWPLLPKYCAKENQNLTSPLGIQGTTKHYWLLLLLMYWQAFCKGVMVRKNFKEELKETAEILRPLFIGKANETPWW